MKYIAVGIVAISTAAIFLIPSASAGFDNQITLGLAHQALDCPSQIELDIIDLINHERDKAGLSPLFIDVRLTEAARSHSEDMADNNFFSHTGSDGASLGTRLTRAGYPWRSAGENIAAGYRSADAVVSAWMDSGGHRANILSTRYDHIGLGYAYNQNATYARYYTSDFGSSSDGVQSPPSHCGIPSPTPTPTQAPIFSDVAEDHWAHDYIELLYQEGYVAGCATEPLMFCPDQTLDRAEIAVFVERGVYGANYTPTIPSNQLFGDVPLWEWFAKWATALWQDGFTSGCGSNPLLYCPGDGHTRAEGSVFFLRMLHGTNYTPPTPIGIFADVPTAAWYADWVEAAYLADLIPPCQTDPLLFCPQDSLDRAMAAYMMVQAKGLDVP